MARIAGVNLPVQKHVVIGLQSIFGVGRSRSKQICASAGVDPATKIKSLTEAEVEKLRQEVGKFTVAACRCAASARAPTRAPARARAVRSRRIDPRQTIESARTFCGNLDS
jgi:ribosomal protein S13